ncbi:MAG: PDZ domain-containing protein [Bacteroidota bacterium]
MKYFFSYLATALLLISSVYSQELGRRASWQARISYPDGGNPGAIVQSIEPDSPLEKAGLQPGDKIIRVNGKLAKDAEAWTEITYSLRADTPVHILSKRGAVEKSLTANLKGRTKEQHAGLDTYYESILNDYGLRQRVIITKPQREGKLPAMFFIGGLSCSSLELPSSSTSNWAKVIRALVEETNMVVMRVEKVGVGDSEGDCSQTDFHTEVAGYRAALQALKQKPYLDTTQIIIYGSSMGSAIAPTLANEFNLKGVISDGTFFKTWYEHMLEIERRIRQMEGDSEAEIVRKMNDIYIPLYHGMLIEKKTYAEVINEYPALAEYNYHAPAHMYGRPVAYYHQLQDFNLAKGWEELKAPVRIMRGTNDWIMSAYDNEMIMQVLERNGHQDHELYQFPGLDHWNTIHQTPTDSYLGKPGEWDEKISSILVEWTKELITK